MFLENLWDVGFDVDLKLDVGSLDVVGDYGVLEFMVNVGVFDVEGVVDEFDVQMSVGWVDFLLDGVGIVDLGVFVGNFIIELIGMLLMQMIIDVSVGLLDLILLDVGYVIDQDVSVGILNIKVQEDVGFMRMIDVMFVVGIVIF